MRSTITNVLPEHVTLLITRTVRTDGAAAFAIFLRIMLDIVTRYPGHLGTVVHEPDEPRSDWRLILRFDTDANLERWANSPELQQFLDATSNLVIGQPHVERVNGFEAWFTLPGRAGTAPPPKWKTAVVSVLAIYPLIMVAQVLLSPLAPHVPEWAVTLVSVVALTPIMTWIAMPALTCLLKGWLYDDAS